MSLDKPDNNLAERAIEAIKNLKKSVALLETGDTSNGNHNMLQVDNLGGKEIYLNEVCRMTRTMLETMIGNLEKNLPVDLFLTRNFLSGLLAIQENNNINIQEVRNTLNQANLSTSVVGEKPTDEQIDTLGKLVYLANMINKGHLKVNKAVEDIWKEESLIIDAGSEITCLDTEDLNNFLSHGNIKNTAMLNTLLTIAEGLISKSEDVQKLTTQ